MKLCCIFNDPSLYRELIYRKMDQEFDCDWYFEDYDNNIKPFDIILLKHAQYMHTIPAGHGFTRVQNLCSTVLDKSKGYDSYITIGSYYDLSTWALALRLKFFHPSKKLYFWTHGWYGKESLPVKIIKKFFFSLADGLFLYGNYARDLMIKEGFNPDKLLTIHNSLDYDKQLELRNCIVPSSIYQKHFSNNNPTLIFIGRLTKVKKLHLLIEAVSILKGKGEKYNVVFVGDGVERNSLELEVESLGLKEQVWFYGACYDQKQNAELIYNADACVSPGNVGLTAMHTLMFGCPVLTHNDFKWQMPEFEAITEGVTGSYFDPDNASSVAKCIANWFNAKRQLREEVRKACYEEMDTQWNPDFQIQVLKEGFNKWSNK